MKTLRLMYDHILVRRIEEDDVTESGLIYIPETAKEMPCKGEVIFVGPGPLDGLGEPQKMNLEPGTKVLYGKYAGNSLEWDGENCVVMRESDVVATLADKQASDSASS